MKFITGGLAGLVAAIFPALAEADTWPTKAVTVIVGNPAGGPSDTLARLVSDHMAKELKVPFVVENKAGGATIPAATDLVRAKPDGYTISFSAAHTHVLLTLVNETNFHPISDFDFIAKVATVPNVFVTSTQAPFATMQDMVAQMKAAPGGIKYATTAPGSLLPLAFIRFLQQAGVEAKAIPYPGAAPIVNALLANDVPVSLLNAPAVVELAKAGKLKIIATTSQTRIRAVGDVPTLAESGFPKIEIDEGIAYGVVAPRGLTSEIREKLAAAVKNAMSDPKVLAGLESMGFRPENEDGGAYRAELERDLNVNRKLVSELGIAKK